MYYAMNGTTGSCKMIAPSTDAATVAQAALNATSGGIVHFKSGQFTILDTLGFAHNNNIIEGEGDATELIIPADFIRTNPHVFGIANGNLLRNLKVTMNYDANFLTLITGGAPDGFLMENVNVIWNAAYGPHVNNIFQTTVGGGKNIVFQNNKFNATASFGGVSGLIPRAVTNIWLLHNYFQDINNPIAPLSPGEDSYDLHVIGNKEYSTETTPTFHCEGMDLKYWHRLSVLDHRQVCSISANSLFSIGGFSADKTCEYATVIGNTFVNPNNSTGVSAPHSKFALNTIIDAGQHCDPTYTRAAITLGIDASETVDIKVIDNITLNPRTYHTAYNVNNLSVTLTAPANADVVIRNNRRFTVAPVLADLCDYEEVEVATATFKGKYIRLGGVLYPNVLSASKVSAFINGDQLMPVNWTKLRFDTETLDLTGEYDATTNYRFTAVNDGYYFIHIIVLLKSPDAGSYAIVGIDKNGSIVKIAQEICPTTSNQSVEVTGFLPLIVGDYLEAWFVHNNGTQRAVSGVSADSSFEIIRIV